MKNYTVIIVAAGKSSRFNQKDNKLLYQLNNKQTIIEQTLMLFLNDPLCTEIIVGVSEETLTFLLKKIIKQRMCNLLWAEQNELIQFINV